jgi:5-methyltetrahydrofolate--homocysteine methyltransferase
VECLVAATDIIKPKLKEMGQKLLNQRVELLALIEGDVHDIGKAIVVTMWRVCGYIVKDLGIDVQRKSIAVQSSFLKRI